MMIVGAEAARARDDRAGGAITGACRDEQRPSCGRELVVAPRRPLFLAGNRGIFPPGRDELLALQPTQDRVDGAAREAGGIDDVEAVAGAVREREQDERGRIGQVHWRRILPM
jgi:hypothetical protein